MLFNDYFSFLKKYFIKDFNHNREIGYPRKIVDFFTKLLLVFKNTVGNIDPQ